MTCGIYLITNSINNKRYVGSSNNIELRWSRHRRDARNGKHSNPHLQAAISKYGIDNFKFELIEVVPDQGDLTTIEQYYLDWIQPEYNISKDAVAFMRGHEFTAEHRAKIGAAHRGMRHSEEAKAKMSIGHKGWTPSDETRERMSAAHKGKKLSDENKAKLFAANKGRTMSPESRAKLSATKKGKPSPLKGIPLSEETKAKLSASMLGRPGHPHTEEHKESMRGDNNPAKRPDVRAKISERQRAAWARRKAAQGNTNISDGINNSSTIDKDKP
jgi:group I intron endonuclease